MTFTQDFTSCFLQRGERAAPIDQTAFDAIAAGTDQPVHALQEQVKYDPPSLLHLPERTDDLAALEPIAARWRTAFDLVIVLGTGGSSLGGKALYALHDCPVGIGESGKSRPPRLVFLDNSDPKTFERAMKRINPGKTGFIVISKSGATAETLTQIFIAWRTLIDRLDDSRVRRHFLVITEPRESPLRVFAERREVPILDHPSDLGGRYSVMSLVGMLPAMIGGVDAAAVRDGATRALHDLTGAKSGAASLAGAGAALNFAAQRSGRNMAVLMPYCDRLGPFAAWWRQLWAESIGKDGLGSTPVPAIGAVDQHSQLQLYLDGPDDKLFTVITVDGAGCGGDVQHELLDGQAALSYLDGRAMGDLIDAQARATVETLRNHGRPVRLIRLGRLEETEIGLLMMHFMLETIVTGGLLGVDPFDQPAVEEGKILARAYLAGEMEPLA